MTARYTAVLDESAHNPLDYDDDTVEISLNDDDDDCLKAAVIQETQKLPLISYDAIFMLWNTLTFSWMKPLLELGDSRPLEQSDLLNLDFSDSAKGVYFKFRAVWKAQYRVNENRASLVYTYLSAFGGPFFAAGLLKLVHDSCLFVGPMILKAIIGYLNDPSIPRSLGYFYCLELFVSQLIMSLCLRQYFFWCFRVGMRLRSCVVTSVFQKALKLSSAALDRRGTGQITNLMSVDSTRLQELTPYLHAVWYSFFQIGVAMYFLWGLVGVASVGGALVIVCCIPITGRISAYLKKTQSELSKVRDERVKVTGEVLTGIKVIKLQAWESKFQSRLNAIRDEEMRLYKGYVLMQSLSGTFSSTIPLLVALATFSSYVAIGGQLDVATALTALALFEVLRFPLSMLPQVMNNLVEARVAVERIRSFLVELEKQPLPQLPLTKPGAVLQKATVVWDSGTRITAEEREEALLAKRVRLLDSFYSRVRALVGYCCVGLPFSTTDASKEKGENDEVAESQFTEEEYELLLCRAQLADALTHIDVLEKERGLQNNLYLRPQTTSLLEECGEDDGLTIDNRPDVGVGVGVGVGVSVSAQVFNSRAADRVLTLARVSLHARPGAVLAIVGQVGAGKSSVLSCLLGDMRVVGGHVCIRGRLAYVGQRPFIQNCTVRDNILFGAEYHKEKYAWALSACALTHDLKMLPAGDSTEIGERGINLSGGQKARVALARAVYSDAEVFLLDDPLSAVDAHVGQHLFEHCIMALQAKGKCVLMSTNALHFLRAVTCIAVMREGRLVESGRFDELLLLNGAFSEMLNAFNKDRTRSANYSHNGPQDSARSELLFDTCEAVPGDTSGVRDVVSFEFDKSNLKDKELIKSGGSFVQTSATTAATASLITAEERMSGSVDRKVYWMWVRAAGGPTALLVLIVLFCAAEVLTLLSSWWLSYWSQYRDSASPWYFLGVFALLNCVVCVSLFSREFSSRRMCWSAGKSLFEEVLHSVMFSPLSFFDTTPSGRIANRLSKDIYTVDEQLPQTIRWYLATLLKVVSSLVYSCVVTPLFILALVPVVMFYISAQRYFVKTSRELSRLDSSSRSPIYALFSETLDGMSTIRAFACEDISIQRINSLLDNNQRAYFLNFSANCWLAVRLEMTGALIVALTALFAVLGRDDSTAPEAEARRQSFAGMTGLALSFALSVTQSLNWSVRMAADLESQMVAVERVKTYSALPQEAPHGKDDDPGSNWATDGEVRFDNVSLRYRAGLPLVLHGVTFAVRAREKVGIVGRTGAGKSSLVVALLRLVELESGQIIIDGRSTVTMGLRTLRSAIAVIPQDPILFSGTLRFNVDPFSQYTDVQVWDSLRRVQLGDSFASLDALIGEGASNLSVGQRQLICIARALLSKCKVIVMDEATAAVDVETDALIQRAIRSEFADSTCLTVAHRLNTIMDSDRVLVMDNGAVREFGSPAELLSNAGSLFSSLVENWERAGNAD